MKGTHCGYGGGFGADHWCSLLHNHHDGESIPFKHMLHFIVWKYGTDIEIQFFVPYVICQFPANIIIRKLGANIWLPSLVVAWGCVSIGMGFTKKWDELVGCRIILGVLEVRLGLLSPSLHNINTCRPGIIQAASFCYLAGT